MLTQQDQDSAHAVAVAVTPSYPRTAARVDREPEFERGALLAGHTRSVCAVLSVAAWAPTAAAIIAGGQLGRGAAVQITLAASMAAAAMGETLLSPRWQTTVSDPGRRGRRGRRGVAGNRPRTAAFIAVLLGSAAAGTALGAVLGSGWRVSLFTTLALVCAAASIAAHRLTR